MLCVVGTVPADDFPLVTGEVQWEGGKLAVGSFSLEVARGTAALIAAASAAAAELGRPAPLACLVGDTGTGKGSRKLYAYLTESLPLASFRTIVFHYLQPIVHWQRKLQDVLGKLAPRPCLIADAGFMYAAKMSGDARLYDLFTPDAGELAFLADEEAPHPFYTRGFILHEENRVPDLIARAYRHGNAARYLLVKGRQDCLADAGGILAVVDSPVEEALEAMGGTGDTLTGLVSLLIDAGMDIPSAAVAAMRANRLAGTLARPTPASQIGEVIRYLPAALREVLAGWATPLTETMSVIDIISGYRETETIFKELEAETGRCICCEGLFLSLGEASERFGFDLDRALKSLNDAVRKEETRAQGKAVKNQNLYNFSKS